MDIETHSSGSVLSQLRNQIGELHTDAVNGHASDLSVAEDTSSQTAAEDDLATTPDDDDDAATVAKKKPSTIDLKSEELFPSLPTAGAGRPLPAWRAPPASAPKLNGVAAANAKKLGVTKAVEKLDIPAALQAKLPASGKGSLTDIVKYLGLKNQTQIEVSTNKVSNATTFFISGKPDAVKQTRRDIVSRVGVQVTETLYVPGSVRPHILGAGGKTLKNITTKTNTRVDIPRSANQDATNGADPLDEEDQPVTITGDFEGVKQAKEEIEAIVAQRVSKYTLRLNVERSYHPFIAGPNNTGIQLIELETGTRVHIPPPFSKDGDEKKQNEISIVGDREGVRNAEERIKALYEQLQRTTRTLSFPVKKRQHRFIIGPKGASLQEILQTTGCTVELPPSSDTSDVITVRGPDNMLSVALQAVLQKANEVTIEEVDIVSLIPKSTDPQLFVKYLYIKERAELRKVESGNNVTIHLMNSESPAPLFEIQGKTKPETEKARIELSELVKQMGSSLFFSEVEIPHGLHKFVIGKGGQNITKLKASPTWEGRLVDLVMPVEADESDDVILVVRRPPQGLAGASGVRPPKPGHAQVNAKVVAAQEAELNAFVDRVREEIVAAATVQSDFVTEVVPVPSKFHGRLIGSNGEKLKELLGANAEEVSVRFPSKDAAEGTSAAKKKKRSGDPTDPNTIFVKGPKKDANEVKERILKLVADLKHIEVISSFSDVLKVKKGLGKKLLQGGGSGSSSSGLGWLIRAVKEAIANTPASHGKVDMTPEQAILNLRVEVEEKPAEDVLTIVGPKVAVSHAKSIIGERATRLADQTTIDVRIFEEVTAAARAVLADSASDAANEIRRRVLRRLIGKEGKNVKALMENHAVYVNFPDRKRKPKKKAAAEEDDGAEDDVSVIEDEDNSVVPPEGLVTIKGNVKDVEAAKKEILVIVNSELVKSFSLTFQIPKSIMPQVVGSQGTKIRAIKDEYDVRVDFVDVETEGDESEAVVEVLVEGSKDGCKQAQAKIMAVVDEFVNADSLEVSIPSYLHKDIIGSSGSRIKKVIDHFGGQDKVKVQFPPRGDSVVGGADTNVVTLKAHRRDLPELKKAVLALVTEVLGLDSDNNPIPCTHKFIDQDTEKVVREVIQFPKSDVSRILGRGGEGLKDLIRKYNVDIWIAESEKDSESVAVTLVARAGQEKGIKGASADVKGKIRVSKTVAIPAKILANLATPGAVHDTELLSVQDLVKKVRTDTHGGATAEISGAATRGKEDSVITVRGDAKFVDTAVKILETGLDELAKCEATQRITIDSAIRPHIIGRAGATITRMRIASGASVDIVRGSGGKSASSDVVVIRGTSEAVASATELVNKIIADQKERLVKDKARDAAKIAAAEAAAASAAAAATVSKGPARIDDDAGEGFSTVNTIPGYSGRPKGGKKKDTSLPASLITGVPTQVTSYYANISYKAEVEEWQDVKKKSKKGEEEVAAATAAVANASVPGAAASTSAKKKKNKKKVVGEAQDSDTPEPVAAPTPTPTPVPVPVQAPSAPAPRPASPTKPAPAPAKSSSSTDKPKPITQAPVRAPSPVRPPPPIYYDEPQIPADDEWQTVKGKSAVKAPIVVEAPVVDGEGAPKKKKNKKKKKKTGAANGEQVNGTVDEDSD
ncbi:hypothetical protein HDV05_000739 [Chytridiales sp. JEL 0842]|nr:hypothetical protein HDV05_000739 [Chytridiales sp. JEL 0842]